MTEVNPTAFLQNAGATHTAEITRSVANALSGGLVSGSTLRARGGVHPSLGSLLAVTQNGSPNMSVNVGSGQALVPGSESSKQGVYSCLNDGTVNKAIAASDPSNPRIDLVVARVQDSFYSGGTNAWSLHVVTGTPAGSPAVPTAPANSVALAQVLVGTGVTTIVNANITDVRPWLVAPGGIIPVRSLAERNALLGLYKGFSVWRQDTDFLNIYDGANWRYLGRPSNASVATNQTTTSTSYVDLTTVGPSVTIETGTAVLVTVSAFVFEVSAGNTAYMSFAVSGASTVAAADANAVAISNNQILQASRQVLLTGLTPGTNIFTAKYRVNGGGASQFADRQIIVDPR